MAWAAAIAGSIIGGNAEKKAADKAAAAQEKLAQEQRQWALEDRAPWQQRLMPQVDQLSADYARGNYNIINPELTSQQYDFFNKQLGLQEADQRTRLLQDLARRGIDATPERLARSLGDFGSKFADVRTAQGLNLASQAATTNWGARQQELAQLLGTLQSGYSGTQAQVGQANQLAYQGLSDANSARLAGANAYANSLIQAANGLAGGIQNYYQYKNWSNYLNNQKQYSPTGFSDGNGKF
jgi:hypothetical protein